MSIASGGIVRTGSSSTSSNAASGTGAARAVAMTVTQRAPNASDITGFTAGQSMWIGPADETWRLDSIQNGKAYWVPYSSPGYSAASAVSGAVVAYSTRRIVATWTGNLFDVTRATDNTTVTVKVLPNGDPDVATLSAFLASANGLGYVSKWYDQSGAANDATQTLLGSMPQIDMLNVVGPNVPIKINGTERGYWATAFINIPVTWVGGTGNVINVTTLSNLDYRVLVGFIVTGANIPAATTITAINYTNGNITLSAPPTATPGNITFTPIGVFLDIPNTATVPWATYSMVMCLNKGPQNQFGAKPFIMGVHGADALNAAASYSGLYYNGNSNTGFRILNGNSGSSSSPAAGTVAYGYATAQVIGYTLGGTGGRDLNFQWNGKQGTFPTFTPTATGTLTGGAIGLHGQFIATSSPPNVGDQLVYDLMVYPTTISLADMTRASTAIQLARGLRPQLLERNIVTDGSSTTAGNGTSPPICWPLGVAERLAEIAPVVPWNAATGGSLEVMSGGLWTSGGPGYASLPTDKANMPLLVHPGMGNSFQASGSLTVSATNTSTGVISITGNTSNTGFAGMLVHISGDVNLPAGAYIIAYTTGNVTVDPAHLPTGNIGTITVQNDTAPWYWDTLAFYFAQARAAGYTKIVLIGSASRKTFSAPQLAEFSTAKVFMQENWRALGVSAYVDLEDWLYFGDDGGMTVTAINGNAVTVSALSAYAATTNRIRWQGMPYSIAGGTGGQTIQGVAGNVLTLSNASGVRVGGTIRAVNPAPWTTYPYTSATAPVWPPDGQHFTLWGYNYQAGLFAQALIDNSLV